MIWPDPEGSADSLRENSQTCTVLSKPAPASQYGLDLVGWNSSDRIHPVAPSSVEMSFRVSRSMIATCMPLVLEASRRLSGLKHTLLHVRPLGKKDATSSPDDASYNHIGPS